MFSYPKSTQIIQKYRKKMQSEWAKVSGGESSGKNKQADKQKRKVLLYASLLDSTQLRGGVQTINLNSCQIAQGLIHHGDKAWIILSGRLLSYCWLLWLVLSSCQILWVLWNIIIKDFEFNLTNKYSVYNIWKEKIKPSSIIWYS